MEVLIFIGKRKIRHCATFGNFDGVGDSFGLFGEESFHFSRTFEVELIAGIVVAVWVGNEVAAL